MDEQQRFVALFLVTIAAIRVTAGFMTALRFLKPSRRDSVVYSRRRLGLTPPGLRVRVTA